LRRTHPHQQHLRATVLEARLFPAQLRHLFPAKRSAEVA
jgi:hypothetical protein